MKYLKRQEGMVAPLVIGLAAVVIIVVGVAVWQSQKAKPQVTASPTPTVKASTSPTPTATPVSGTTSFAIKELGIQLQVTSDLKDLVYTTQIHSGVTSAYFSTASLVAADKAAGGKYCTPGGDAPVGVIDLSAATPQGEGLIKIIGGKHLNYSSQQSVCSEDSSVMNLAKKQAQSFRQALDSAEAIH